MPMILVLQHHQHIKWRSNSSGGDYADIIGVTAPPESLQLRAKWKSNVRQLGPPCIEHRPDDDYYRCGSDDMMMSKKYLHIKKPDYSEQQQKYVRLKNENYSLSGNLMSTWELEPHHYKAVQSTTLVYKIR